MHVWNPDGPEPCSIAEVLNRQKDVQYASRSRSQVARQKQIHKLRHVVAELAARCQRQNAPAPKLRELASYGCVTRCMWSPC